MGFCDADIPSAQFMNCYRLKEHYDGVLSPAENGTTYRCGCNRLFPLDGELCDEPRTAFFFAVIMFFLQFVIRYVVRGCSALH